MSKSNCTQQGHDEVNVYRESHYLCVDQGNVDPGVAKGRFHLILHDYSLDSSIDVDPTHLHSI